MDKLWAVMVEGFDRSVMQYAGVAGSLQSLYVAWIAP